MELCDGDLNQCLKGKYGLNKDNKFIIVSLNGAKNFENREDCYKKMDSVIIDLNKFFALA